MNNTDGAALIIRKPVGIEVMVHTCTACGRTFRCSVQREGRGCNSTVNQGYCEPCARPFDGKGN